MKDWDDLHTMLALGRSGTLKGAAKELDVSETTVTRRLKRLSDERIAALFAREGQHWIPTPLGARLIEICEEVEHRMIDARHALDEADGQPGGLLRVESLPFLNAHFIGPSLNDLHASFPKLHIELTAVLRASDLGRRDADVALRLARPETGRVLARRISYAPMAAISPAPGENGWVGLSTSLDKNPVMQAASTYFGEEPTIRADSFDSIISTARATGLGAVAPSCLLRRQNVQLSHTPLCSCGLWVIFHEDMRESAKLRAFLTHLDTVFPSSSKCLCGECVH